MILYGKCFVKQLYCEAVTETAGMPKQKKDLVHRISSNTTSAPTCMNSESVPYPHQPVLSYQCWYFSDTKRRDMQASNDQKAEKDRVYLLFWDTLHYIISLAKGGNLGLQKEKKGKSKIAAGVSRALV